MDKSRRYGICSSNKLSGEPLRCLERRTLLNSEEAAITQLYHWQWERGVFLSLGNFASVSSQLKKEAELFYANLEKATGLPKSGRVVSDPGNVVYQRNAAIRGPLSVFSYDYFLDHYGKDQAGKIRLLSFQGLWGSGSEYAYEVLNLVDGNRRVAEIRNAVSAELGPIPFEWCGVLQALESIQVVTLKK